MSAPKSTVLIVQKKLAKWVENLVVWCLSPSCVHVLTFLSVCTCTLFCSHEASYLFNLEWENTLLFLDNLRKWTLPSTNISLCHYALCICAVFPLYSGLYLISVLLFFMTYAKIEQMPKKIKDVSSFRKSRQKVLQAQKQQVILLLAFRLICATIILISTVRLITEYFQPTLQQLLFICCFVYAVCGFFYATFVLPFCQSFLHMWSLYGREDGDYSLSPSKNLVIADFLPKSFTRLFSQKISLLTWWNQSSAFLEKLKGLYPFLCFNLNEEEKKIAIRRLHPDIKEILLTPGGILLLMPKWFRILICPDWKRSEKYHKQIKNNSTSTEQNTRLNGCANSKLLGEKLQHSPTLSFGFSFDKRSQTGVENVSSSSPLTSDMQFLYEIACNRFMRLILSFVHCPSSSNVNRALIISVAALLYQLRVSRSNQFQFVQTLRSVSKFTTYGCVFLALSIRLSQFLSGRQYFLRHVPVINSYILKSEDENRSSNDREGSIQSEHILDQSIENQKQIYDSRYKLVFSVGAVALCAYGWKKFRR